MRTLSIRQPWAWLIVRPDITDPAERSAALRDGRIKPVENRDWAAEFRGDFLLHASQGLVQRDYRETQAQLLDLLGVRVPDFTDPQIQRGGIVGRTTLVDVVTDHPSPYFVGPYGLVLANTRPLPFVPLKGALGFFKAPPEVLDAIAHHERQAA